MFEESAVITEGVERLFALADSHERGQFIAWDKIEAAAGFSRNDVQCRYIVSKFFKRYLRERGIAFRPEPGVGYRMLTESEQVRVCGRDRNRKAFRQLGTAIKEIEGGDVEKLSMADRRLRFYLGDKMRKDRTELGRSVREVDVVHKTETVPRRTIQPAA